MNDDSSAQAGITAIVSGAGRRGVKPQPSASFEALPGRGARATVRGHSVAVGGPRMLADAKAALPPELDQTMRIWESEGRTVLYVLRDRAVIGGLAVEDEIRPESAEAVKALHELGIRVAMVTGDSQTVAVLPKGRYGVRAIFRRRLSCQRKSLDLPSLTILTVFACF